MANIGMPQKVDAATALYCALMPMTGLPPETTSARPRTAVMVPRVMIKGGRLPTATPMPLAMPTAKPASMATTRGTISG